MRIIESFTLVTALVLELLVPYSFPFFSGRNLKLTVIVPGRARHIIKLTQRLQKNLYRQPQSVSSTRQWMMMMNY